MTATTTLTDSHLNLDNPINYPALLESLLFVSSGPVPVNRLAEALDITSAQAKNHLKTLENSYEERGLRLQWQSSGVQLTTMPTASAAIERFAGLQVTTRLSQAALELLAVVAYQQPITRPQIDEIRGVNSDGVLRTLLSKGLIEEVGRQETPGRPILYAVTSTFLQHFGLASLEALPPLPTQLLLATAASEAVTAEAPADDPT